MSKNDDGHGPETCTYNECNADSDQPCPFLKEKYMPMEPGKPYKLPTVCKHQWRQYWISTDNTPTGARVAIPVGWFCIHCKKINQ